MTLLSRREFINKIMRWGLAGLLSGSGLYLLTRSTKEEHQCVKDYPSCRNCLENTHCLLPQAMSFRNVFMEQKNKEKL